MLKNLKTVRVSIFGGKRESLSEGSISPCSTPDADFTSSSAVNSSPSETLEATLADKQGRKLFREYLRSQYCSEVLQFYEAVEEFENYLSKKLKLNQRPSFGSSATRSDSWPTVSPKSSIGKKINKMALFIFEKYISFDASCELNINTNQRKRVVKILEECQQEERCVPFSIFSELLDEIFISMKRDNWPKFIKTEAYEKWKASLK